MWRVRLRPRRNRGPKKPVRCIAAVVAARAKKLAAGPTGAYGRIRTLLTEAPDAGLADHLDAEREAFRETTATADFREGVTAFLEKRSAVFTGR